MPDEMIAVSKREYEELLEVMKRAERTIRRRSSINNPLTGDSPGLAGYYLRCPDRPIFEGIINGMDELCRQAEKLIAQS